MANKIQVKRSAVAAKVPTTTDLDLGEIAINTYDGKMYIKKDNGTPSVVEIGASSSVSDGDKGDITVASSGTSWTIDNGVIGTAKLGGDITTAGKALLDDADASAQRTTLAAAGTGVANTFSANQTITSSNANALAVGRQGTTSPALNIDASTASSATGLNVKAAAAAGGVAVSAISSGTNENLTIDAKGSGVVTINNTATGAVTIGTTTNTNSSKLVVAGTISETVGSTQYKVLSQYDVGTAPDQVPLNQYLGRVAYVDTVTVSKGGTGLSSATAYAVLCGGTTSTGAFQSIASLGTSGQVLTSNGAGALPTFQDATGGSSAGGAIWETSKTISSNYSITSGKNAFSVGPITILSATVTIPSGSRWLVL